MLLRLDDFAVLVVAAIAANIMRALGGAALRAHGARRDGGLVVGAAACVGDCSTSLSLGYCH